MTSILYAYCPKPDDFLAIWGNTITYACSTYDFFALLGST